MISSLRHLFWSALVLLLVAGCGSDRDEFVFPNDPIPPVGSVREVTFQFDYSDPVLGRIPAEVTNFTLQVFSADGDLLFEQALPGGAQATVSDIPTTDVLLRLLGRSAAGTLLGYADFSLPAGSSSVTIVVDTLLAGTPPAPSFTREGLGVPARLGFLIHPQDVEVDEPFQVAVVALDALGYRVADPSGSVSLALSGNAALVGANSAPFSNGVATFSGLSVAEPGAGYTLTATSSGLSSANSLAFTVTGDGPEPPPPVPVASALGFAIAPAGAVQDEVFDPVVTVQVLDQDGEPFAGEGVEVTLALAAEPAPPTGALLLGQTSAITDAQGVATFDQVWISQAGTYALTATATDLDGAFTDPFVVAVGAVTDEITVNQTTTEDQIDARIAADTLGRFVVVWEDESEANDRIVGRRFLPDGTPLGDEFVISGDLTVMNTNPSVAPLPNGGFVVVWEKDKAVGNSIFGRYYDTHGEPVGPEFLVSDEGELDNAARPQVATDADGRMVVAWLFVPDGEGRRIQVRRFAADGTPLAASFTASPTVDIGSEFSLAAAPDFRFVLAWERYTGIVVGRLYDAQGDPVDNAFTVNQAGDMIEPAVGMAADGSFVVTFGTTNGTTLYARLYEADGTPKGNEFSLVTSVNFLVNGNVAMMADGPFAVVFSSEPNTGTNQVMLARYEADGTSVSGPDTVNQQSVEDADHPWAALNAGGTAGVVWREEDLGAGDNSNLRFFPFGFPVPLT